MTTYRYTIILEREADNEHDANAIAVRTAEGQQVGYLNRALAEQLAPSLDEGTPFGVEVASVSGGEDARSLGVNILVTRLDREADRLELVGAGERERGRG